MLELRQFRPALYFLLTLGLCGFALATETTGLWVLAMSGMVLNAWLIKTDRFVPLPRLVATLITVVALAYAVHDLRSGETAIIVVGEFLVMLHLVKIFEQRSNRDYAQLLVLSLLLMAAAAISTVSLLFGVLMLAYLLISLYCSLLFHLKVEAEAARNFAAKALPASMPPPEKLNPAALRQDQRRLAASMRLLTLLISFVSIGMGVAVFLFFPRGGDDMFGRRMFTPPQAVTGLTDKVSMDQVAQINQSDQMVAAVKITRDGKPWGGTEPMLLRGVTLDRYTGAQPDESPLPRYHWIHADESGLHSFRTIANSLTPLTDHVASPDGAYIQEIDLQPTGSYILPAMAGADAIQTDPAIEMSYQSRDGVMMRSSNDYQANSNLLHYTVQSSGQPPPAHGPAILSNIDPRIRDYALLPDVSGSDDSGRLLVSLRGTPDAPPDLDLQIAANIQKFLRSPPFKYTLDLTDARDIFAGEDPIVTFLTRVKRGHCEYYAGAMTLLCQSLGMDARMVLGYRCDYYNSVGQIYIILQSQAHAWVEVRGKDGWVTFDPTNGDEVITADAAGFFGKLKSIFDYLQYQWGSSVVAYGRENRDNIVKALDDKIVNTANHSADSLRQMPSMIDKLLDKISEIIDNPTPIGILATLMVIAMISFIAYYAWEKLRLRRRAWRIGIFNLPNRQRKRLACSSAADSFAGPTGRRWNSAMACHISRIRHFMTSGD
jgi:Ca2+/Na+ antiporter